MSFRVVCCYNEEREQKVCGGCGEEGVRIVELGHGTKVHRSSQVLRPPIFKNNLVIEKKSKKSRNFL